MNRSNDSSRTVAELRDELLGFTHPSAVRRIASAVRSADEVQALYALLSAGEEPLAYRAAWTLCHLAPTWDAVLRERYNELVAAALDCPHAGRRRLLLALLYRQPQPEPLRMPDAKVLRWWRENKSWAALSCNAAIPVLAHPERPAARIPDAGRAAGTRPPAAVAARRAPQRTGRARPQPPAAAEVNDRHVVRQCRARSASKRDPRSADHRDLHLHNKNPSLRKEGFGKVRRYGPMACPANRRYFA